MIDLLLQDGLRPFLSAVGIVAGLLLLELLLMIFGISTAIGEGGHDFGGHEFDGSVGSGGAGVGLDGQGSGAAPELVDPAAPLTQHVAHPGETHEGTPLGGLLDIVGLRSVPLTIWFAILATSFAALGFAGQSALQAITGTMLPSAVAGLAACLPALALTSVSTRLLARLLPKETTSAISDRTFGRRFGEVTVGVARLSMPAQVRVTDQHGNLHYLMAEPLDPRAVFREGSRVLVLRAADGAYRLVAAE